MNALDYIRVVLVAPTHPGNIGAAARAMANMGVAQLALVAPREFPHHEATARAAGADHILRAAKVVDDLDDAIADCRMVIGASARLRSIKWPQLAPDEAMQKAAAASRDAPVAILFGRESRGLTNDELDRCHYLVQIPSDEKFPSLNIASAVIVLLYELRRATLRRTAADNKNKIITETDPLATAEQMQNFYNHLHETLILLKFSTHRSGEKLHRKLTRLFNRTQLYEQEVKMLRGIFNAIEEEIKRAGKFS